MLAFVVSVAVVVGGAALLRRLSDSRVTLPPARQEVSADGVWSSHEYAEGELAASLRRPGGLLSLWHAGVLVVEGGEVWWQGGLRGRRVVLTGMTVAGVKPRRLYDVLWVKSTCEVLVCRGDDQRLVEVAVESEGVDFLRAALTR